ncbi:MAG: HEAT repeat domain-containing protein [Desulfobacula sp.]|nr:HEAT repeat domain-containing protein [Desulfobacula sp.]
MIPNMPTIGVRFDIEKAGGSYYGLTCWKVFWQAINPEEIGVASLYAGDTATTLNGRENVFCIAVQSLDSGATEKVKAALAQSEAFNRVCANPMFVEGTSCAAEPLQDAGRIDAEENLVGNDGASRSALGVIKKERATTTQVTKDIPIFEKSKLSSARPRTLPTISSFKELSNKCDICTDPIRQEDMIKVTREQIEKAYRYGFYPASLYKHPLTELHDHPWHAWNFSVTQNKETDWGICQACDNEIKDYLFFNAEFLTKLKKNEVSEHQFERKKALGGDIGSIQYLVSVKDRFAVSLLVHLFKNQNFRECDFAPRALGRLGDRRAIPALLKVIEDDRISSSVRHHSAIAIGRINDRQALRPLIELLKKVKNESVISGIVKALGEIGDAKAIPSIVETLNNSTDFIRLASVNALGMIGDKQALPYLESTIEDSNKDVRKASKKLIRRISKQNVKNGFLKRLFG